MGTECQILSFFLLNVPCTGWYDSDFITSSLVPLGRFKIVNTGSVDSNNVFSRWMLLSNVSTDFSVFLPSEFAYS